MPTHSATRVTGNSQRRMVPAMRYSHGGEPSL